MLIKIGTLVLCHLIIKSPAGEQTQVIEQVPGIVKEISYVDKIEMFGDQYAVKTKKTMLLVEPEEKDKIFRIGVDACRPVLDEATHLELARKKMKARSAKEQPARVESLPADSPKKEEKVEILDTPPVSDEKEDLLNNLMPKKSLPEPKKVPAPVPAKEKKDAPSSDKTDLLKQLEE